jgi:hypothetical protein
MDKHSEFQKLIGLIGLKYGKKKIEDPVRILEGNAQLSPNYWF